MPIKILLFAIAFISIFVIVFALYYMDAARVDLWAVIAAALAVISSAISGYAAWEVIDMERNRLRPSVTAYIDTESRNQLAMFTVKNEGLSSAYNISLSWKGEGLKDYNGQIVDFIKGIQTLRSGQCLSKTIGAHHEAFRKNKEAMYQLDIHFQDGYRKKYSSPIVLSFTELEGTVLFSKEDQLTQEKIQKIPDKLDAIAKGLSVISSSLKSK